MKCECCGRGDLPEELAAKYAAQRKAFDGLQKSCASLAECLGLKMPALESGTTRLKATEAAVGVISGRVSIECPLRIDQVISTVTFVTGFLAVGK